MSGWSLLLDLSRFAWRPNCARGIAFSSVSTGQVSRRRGVVLFGVDARAFACLLSHSRVPCHHNLTPNGRRASSGVTVEEAQIVPIECFRASQHRTAGGHLDRGDATSIEDDEPVAVFGA